MEMEERVSESKPRTEDRSIGNGCFRNLFENCLDAIFLTRPDGTILAANPAAQHMFGMTEDELRAAGREGIVVPDQRLVEALRERASTGAARAKLTYRRKDGTTFPGEVTSSMFTDADGTVKTSMIVRDDSDWKRAEEALEQSDERFRLALRYAPVSVAVQDRDLRYIWAYNQRTAPPGGIVGLTDADIFTAEEAKKITAIKSRVLHDGVEARDQLWLDRPSGPIYLDITWSPVRDNEGKVVGITSVTIDLTPMKRAEDALKESEAKYRTLFESIQEHVSLRQLIFDQGGEVVDSIFLDSNSSNLKVLGFDSIDEVRGKRDNEIYGPQMFAVLIGHMNEMVAARIPITREVHYDTNGHDYLTTWVPLAGNRVLATSVDITDQKRAQRRAEESVRHERERRQELEALMDAVPATTWISRNAEGTDMVGNKATEKLLGMAPGSNVSETAPLEERPAHFRAYRNGSEIVPEELPMQKAGLSGQPVIGDEFELRFDDGQSVWMYGNAIPLLDDFGRSRGAVGAFVDVSELKRTAEETKRSNEELQQFAYVVSHDLKEPLRNVTNYVELVMRKYQEKALDEKAFEHLGLAVEGATRMRRMIDDMLSYSTIETQGGSFSDVSLEAMVATVLKDLNKAIEESGASVTYDALPTVWADGTQMVLLLENLVSNAIKYRNEAAPQIHISVLQDGREWRFSVCDNGIGIESRFADKVFQMFQRLHSRDEYEGTGIGLAIAKKIVERHHGRIWFESTPGEGTTFYFTIPA